MAQEGIATLPQSPENSLMMNFSGDLDSTKNAVSQQLGPEAMGGYQQSMDQLVSSLNLPVEELQTLMEVLQYLLKNEQQYPQLRQRLIQEAGLDPEDMPEEFDRGYLTTMMVVVQEALNRAQGQGNAQMPQPQGFYKGGLAGAAEALRQQGRGGDTILAHINPEEARMLKAMGGSGTINPATGLMQFKGGGPLKAVGNAFKSVGNAVKSVASSPIGRIVATVALTAALGPAGLGMSTMLAAGLAGTAVSLAGGSNLKTALISGVTSGALAGIAPNISSALPGAGGYLNAAATGAIMGGGYAAVTGGNIAQGALTGGVLAGGVSAFGGANATGPGTQPGVFSPDQPRQPAPVIDRSQGIGDLATNIAPPANAPVQPAADAPVQPPANQPMNNPIQDYSTRNMPMNNSAEDYSTRNMPTNQQASAPVQPSANAPTTDQPANGPMDYLTKTKNALFSSDPKDPGFFYNNKGEISIPAVAGTVLAGGALTGGFKQTDPAPPGIVNKNVTGQTLLEQNPNAYVVGGLPGYNAPAQSPYLNNVVPTPMFGQPRATPYNPLQPVRFAANGGISDIYPRKTGKINGPGTGTSDSIPAMLSDGEFVLTAKAVRGAGKGSRRDGAKKLYRMMHALEKKAGGKI